MRAPRTRMTALLILMTLLAAILPAGAAHANDALPLLDRVVPWPDGTRERVEIGSDGCFRLDGKKMRLVGIDLGTTGLPKPFFDPASLATFDKELTYLEAAGVRLVHVNFGYVGYKREVECYTGLLQLLQRHKMLVFPLISGKWLPNFGSLETPDFRIGGGDSLSQWADRWCDVMAGFPNVVAVAAENELDIPQKPPVVPAPQQYTAAGAAAYMRLLTSVLRSRLHVPIVTKLVGEVNASWPWRPDIKEAVLPFSDVPCLDLYYPSERDLDTHLDAALAWLREKGFRTGGLWVAEANAGTGKAPRAAGFGTGYLDCMFGHGASVVCLWVANRTQNPDWAFFDKGGRPVPALERIVADLGRLQAPVAEPPGVSATAPAAAAPVPATIPSR